MRRNEILDEWVKVFRENFDIELVRRHEPETALLQGESGVPDVSYAGTS